MSARMGYIIRQEFTPDRWAIVFECDPQSRAALLQDFPWLRSIGAVVQAHRPLSDSAPATESEISTPSP
jgi:hypothetical protein